MRPIHTDSVATTNTTRMIAAGSHSGDSTHAQCQSITLPSFRPMNRTVRSVMKPPPGMAAFACGLLSLTLRPHVKPRRENGEVIDSVLYRVAQLLICNGRVFVQ